MNRQFCSNLQFKKSTNSTEKSLPKWSEEFSVTYFLTQATLINGQKCPIWNFHRKIKMVILNLLGMESCSSRYVWRLFIIYFHVTVRFSIKKIGLTGGPTQRILCPTPKFFQISSHWKQNFTPKSSHHRLQQFLPKLPQIANLNRSFRSSYFN